MSLIETDSLSNQDLSSRLEIASLTAGQYYKQVQAQIYLDQLAGNGDYVIDVTHQRAGAGTAFRTVNVTQTVESGVTSLKATTITFPVNNTDVIKVYVTGLAGDTTTPDTIVEWHDVSSLTAAEVNAEVVDALDTDTYAEPTGAPGATVSLSDKLGYLYMALRNKLTVTASAKTFHDDSGAAEWSKSLSDDGTTYTENEGA